MACGIAVHQWAKADLVGDAGAGEALGDDPDYQAKHGEQASAASGQAAVCAPVAAEHSSKPRAA